MRHWRSYNKQRRHSILVFLAVAGVIGSLLQFQIISEADLPSFEYDDYNRRLDAKPMKPANMKNHIAKLLQYRAYSRMTRLVYPSSNEQSTIVAPLENTLNTAAATGPNVIYIQHESLSGSLMLNTEDGIKATPFFQDMIQNDPNMFVFEHALSGSGNTIDALPSLMTGCLPYNAEGVEYAQSTGQSIGYDFHNLGYHTASFTTRVPLDEPLVGGKSNMLHDLLVGGMDKVVDPISQSWLIENEVGNKDRRTLPLFEEWIHELEDRDSNAPFYAQFYNFDTQYPYTKNQMYPAQEHPYSDSLFSMDDFLNRLFALLKRNGQLENTIIIGSGDHGEIPTWQAPPYARLKASTSDVYHTLSYIYYPQGLIEDQGVASLLRTNTQKLTYTLDIYPTLQSILRRATSYNENIGTPEGCITGIDLTSVDISEDRVVLQQNLASSEIADSISPAHLWAISTKDLSLYHRLHDEPFPELHQRQDSAYVLEYGECTPKADPSRLCQMKVHPEHLEYFRGAIQWIKDTNLLGEGVKTSEVVNYFSMMTGSWSDAPNSLQ